MSANYFSNQRVAEFSLLSIAAFIPALAWMYVPVFFIIAVFMIPASLAVLVRRLDLHCGLASLTLIFVLVSLISGKPQEVFLLLFQTGPLGLLLGLLFKNYVSSTKALTITIFFSLSVLIVMIFVNYMKTGNNPLVLNEGYKSLFNYERQLVHEAIKPGGMVEKLDQSTVGELEKMIDWLEGKWPVMALSIAFVWGIMSAIAAYMITRLAMINLRHSVPKGIPFTRWKLPWYTIWGFIVGLALMLAGDWWHIGSLSVAGKAILWTMGFVVLVTGLSLFVFYFRRWKVPIPLKILNAVLMGVYLPITALLLVVLGILDTIINIRRLNPEGRIPEEDQEK